MRRKRSLTRWLRARRFLRCRWRSGGWGVGWRSARRMLSRSKWIRFECLFDMRLKTSLERRVVYKRWTTLWQALPWRLSRSRSSFEKRYAVADVGRHKRNFYIGMFTVLIVVCFVSLMQVHHAESLRFSVLLLEAIIWFFVLLRNKWGSRMSYSCLENRYSSIRSHLRE